MSEIYFECPLCNFKHKEEKIMALHFWRHHREYRKQLPSKIFDSIRKKLLVISDKDFEKIMRKWCK